jgi:RND superfamily putative drug exporter
MRRVGAFCARRKWIVLVAWVALVAGVISAATLAGGSTNAPITVPGTSAQEGANLLQRAFPGNADLSGQIVVTGPQGTMGEAATQRLVERVVRDVRSLPNVRSVGNPFDPGGLISEDRSTAVIDITYDYTQANDITPATYRLLRQALRPLADREGFSVAYAGTPAAEVEQNRADISEAVGLLAAVIILLVAFGTVGAMVSPLISALSGLVLGIMSIRLLASAVDISAIAPTLATMIGLGVGIDYAVFIVNRVREELRAGRTVEEAIPAAVGTAGRAVLVAGITVAIALLGLVAAEIPAVTMLGVTAAIAVVTAILAALTLLPAVLAVVGERVLRRRERSRNRTGTPAAVGEDIADGVWGRWARLVGNHPIPFLLLALVILAVLTVPLLSMRLGQVDAGSDPPGSTTRLAYDRLADRFGPGINGPIALVLSPYDDQEGAARIVERLAKDRDVKSVAPPRISTRDRVTMIDVIPRSAPTAEATARLVERLPREVRAETGDRVQVDVTGLTAAMLQIADRITQRLPFFIGAVLLLSFLILMVEFRSLLVPLKAAIMNLLSIGAAYGAIVAIFQWGWGAGLIGVPERVAIEAYVPMMLFAILFGLSMDYEVFLLSRIREAFLRGVDARRSVEVGLSQTARVITAAALIMITVFASFVLVDNVVVKMFGVGLAVAVLVDATIVRLMLVPATMVLLGRANWWFPFRRRSTA